MAVRLGREMPRLDEPPVVVRRRRGRSRRRWWIVAASAVVTVLSGVGVFWWLATRPPGAVSVGDVLHRFRASQPTSGPAAPTSGGPALGVYVYATNGYERISAGDITHHYPARTTLTVTTGTCGLQLRWDALAGRWWKAQVCATSNGWQLAHYTDAHKFLYRQDVHDYVCRPPTTTPDGWSVACVTSGGELTSAVHPLGIAAQSLAGRAMTTMHVRIDQHASGKSVSAGTIDALVLPSGLPVHVQIDDRGSQVVLGSRITYEEHASFDLTSLTPQR